MRLKNVYVGYNRADKECLLYMTNLYYEGVGLCTVFIDLETDDVYQMTSINMNNLIPFKKLVNGRRLMTKKKVISTYKLDRETTIDIRDLFYADISKKYVSYYKKDSSLAVVSCIVEKELGKNVLVERTRVKTNSGSKSVYKDLTTGEVYDDAIGCSGYTVPFVEETRKFDESVLSGKYPKRKILEMNYRGEVPKI